jgi:hypothetical protein
MDTITKTKFHTFTAQDEAGKPYTIVWWRERHTTNPQTQRESVVQWGKEWFETDAGDAVTRTGHKTFWIAATNTDVITTDAIVQ